MIKDEAVSELIGVVLMISIGVLVMGIIGTFFFSMVNIQNIPQVDLSIVKNANNDLVILFNRGDPLLFNKTKIKIGDSNDDMKSQFLIRSYQSSSFSYYWNESTPFQMGEVLLLDKAKYNSNVPVKVIISYNPGDGEYVLIDTVVGN